MIVVNRLLPNFVIGMKLKDCDHFLHHSVNLPPVDLMQAFCPIFMLKPCDITQILQCRKAM